MNTETKAAHDALGASQRNAANNQSHNFDESKAKLVADLKILVADAEKMIKEAADSSAEGFAVLRTRFEGKLGDAKAQLGRAKTAVDEKARHAADATQAYVKANPWQSVGILAAAGALFGFLLGRRAPPSDAPDVPKE